MLKKIIIINILIILILMTNITCAVNTFQYKPTTPRGYSEFTNIGGNIISVIKYLGIIASVIAITIMGLMYMLGSVDEKAEFKKHMMPYIVGCVFLAMTPVIVGMIEDNLEYERKKTLIFSELHQDAIDTLIVAGISKLEAIEKFCNAVGIDIEDLGVTISEIEEMDLEELYKIVI